MARRFTLAGLLLWTMFIGVALAYVVPLWRDIQRQNANVDRVISIAASADGSTFAALLGDRRVLIWDNEGNLKTELKPPATVGGKLALSFDGKWLAFSVSDDELFATAPRGRVELWRVDTGKRVRTLPPQINEVRFSPTQESFIALGDAGLYAPQALADESPPALIAGPASVAFSPDGKTIASVKSNGVVELYDAATSRLRERKRLRSQSAKYTLQADSIVWATDGRSILANSFAVTGGSAGKTSVTPVADRWYVDTGNVRRLPANELSVFAKLAYLPGNPPRLVTTNPSGLAVLDAETLKPLPTDIADYWYFAVGLRGETFLASSDNDRIDLVDTATLKSRRRLHEAPSLPSFTPVFIVYFVWFIALAIHRTRQYARVCQACGKRFTAAGKKDLNLECPACRQKSQNQRLTPGEASTALRRQSRQGWAILLAFDAALAAGFAFLTCEQFGFWIPFAAVLIGLPAVVLVLLYWRMKKKLRQVVTPEDDAALADAAARGTGTVRRSCEMLVWSAPGTSLADILEAEVRRVRERMATAIGRPVPEPAGRAFVFADEDSLLGYIGRLGVTLDARFIYNSVYLGSQFKKMLFCERRIRERSDGPRPAFGSAIFHHLLERCEAHQQAAWVTQGLASMLSSDEQSDELDRLNRRLRAGRAAGRTIGAKAFFTATGLGNWRKHDSRAELEHFAWSDQFAAQAWSMVEFVCGRGATPERRQAFQHFFNDPARGKRPAQAIERHFGCSCDELFEHWQAWVSECGNGEHHPPPPDFAAYLIAGPITKIVAAETPRRERATAIRELGQYGYVLGADALVALLDREDEEMRAEAVWALECISGEVLGTSVAAWQDWWRRAATTILGESASPAQV